MRHLIIVTSSLLILLSTQVMADEEEITLQTLLEEMTDRTTLARFPDPEYTCKQFSSWDRGSVSPDEKETWFANADRGMYLRTEENDGRKEWVMMDAEGPGVVVRIWSANPAGNLRVYLDRNPKPVIEGPMEEIMSGKWKIGEPLSAERSKGYNLYLPIPYAEHCKVTSDAGDFYYQINYRTYEAGTSVETLTPEELDESLARIMATGKALLLEGDFEPIKRIEYSSFPSGIQPRGQQLTGFHERESTRGHTILWDIIEPGDSLKLELPEGPAVITQISIYLRETQAPHRDLVLEIRADGLETVWCPLGDFIGTGVGAEHSKDFYRVSEADRFKAVSLWPMPYKDSCEISITNYRKKKIHATFEAHFDDWHWDDRSMHFYTRWRYEYPIHTVPMIDWNYVDIEGQGVFVGDQLSVMNPSEIWWGEGDEKFYIDGETFPSHFGTGTEDYYGYAWCSNQLFIAPFHGQPRCDGFVHGNNWGHTTVSRVRALDAIPFKKSLKFDMEVWHWRECDVSYAATTFFYAKPGATHNRAPDPEAAAAPVVDPPPLPPPHKIEDAIECEDMEIVAHTEGIPIERQGMKSYGREVSSAERQLFVRPEGPGGFVEVRFPVDETGAQRVKLYATRSWDYAIVRFFINGKRAGEDVDLFNSEEHAVAATGPIDLGVHEPSDGAMTLRVEVMGRNPDSEHTGSYFGIDCVVLGPETE